MDARRYIKVDQDTYIDTVGPPQNKRKVPLVEIIVCLVIICIIAAILFPVFAKSRENAHSPNCQSNQKQMGLGMAQYVQDNDEAYPPTAVHNLGLPYGWADTIQPYLKSLYLYHCPLNPTTHVANPRSINYTDYWMNGNLSKAYLADLPYPATTILYGDGNDGQDSTNARYSLRALPPSWKNDHTTPAWRHLDTANYCFADGHVKALAGERVTKGNDSSFTFALK